VALAYYLPEGPVGALQSVYKFACISSAHSTAVDVFSQIYAPTHTHLDVSTMSLTRINGNSIFRCYDCPALYATLCGSIFDLREQTDLL